MVAEASILTLASFILSRAELLLEIRQSISEGFLQNGRHSKGKAACCIISRLQYREPS